MTKVYEIEISNVDLSPHHTHVLLAENFEEAFKKAQKILIEYIKEIPDAKITEITVECAVHDEI